MHATMLLCEFVVPLGTEKAAGARTVLRDILTRRERLPLGTCRMRLNGGKKRGRVLLLGNYEGSLPIHPSAGMKERKVDGIA